ncbi:hypothetical protein ACNKHN_02630 [Shigella flexneri]
MRRDIAELNGEGEVAAGGDPAFRRYACEVIAAVKDKLETLKSSLPEGVEIVTTYYLQSAHSTAPLTTSAASCEEFIVVAVVCALFLCTCARRWWRLFRCAGLCIAFIVMHFQGTERQYYVVGWHCDRRRGDGRCRYRHDRECA